MKTFSAVGIVLKRSSVGESDRIVTLFTREQGKLSVVAKGARKITSSKVGSLEPGCLCKVYCVETKSLPILTQMTVIDDFSRAKQTLVSMKQLFQILEIIDTLFMEADAHEELFSFCVQILQELDAPTTSSRLMIRECLLHLVKQLGFEEEAGTEKQRSIQEMVEDITARHLHSFEFLTIPN